MVAKEKRNSYTNRRKTNMDRGNVRTGDRIEHMDKGYVHPEGRIKHTDVRNGHYDKRIVHTEEGNAPVTARILSCGVTLKVLSANDKFNFIDFQFIIRKAFICQYRNGSVVFM